MITDETRRYHKSASAVDRVGEHASKPCMRYWVNGEDENYERELERVTRFGGPPPAPMSPSDVAGLVFLVGIQAVLFTSAIAAFVLSLR
jgi:hypothetical protein